MAKGFGERIIESYEKVNIEVHDDKIIKNKCGT